MCDQRTRRRQRLHASDAPQQPELSDTAKLRGAHPLRLDVAEHYEVHEHADGWSVAVVGYLYGVEYEDRELVAYHWHPHGESPITWPHMHVAADIQVGDGWLAKVHLPTGAVGLERVVALAIAELRAAPLRDDWERLVGETAVG